MRNFAGRSPFKSCCKKCGVELNYVYKGGYCEKHKGIYEKQTQS